MNRKLKMVLRVISMALVIFITVQVIPVHSYAAEEGAVVPEQQEILVPADYEQVLDKGYQTYTMDAGRGGKLVLSTIQGKNELKGTRADMSFSGNRLSASVSWLYQNGEWINQYDLRSIVHHEGTKYTAEYYTLDKSDNKGVNFNKKTTSADGSVIWKSSQSESAELTVTSGGYILKDETSQITFNQNGALIGLKNLKNNDTVQVLRLADGNIQKIIDAAGRDYRFSYQAVNGISSLTSITAYNSNGSVIKVGGTNSTVSYSYLKDGDRNRLASATYPDGKKVLYSYETGKLAFINDSNKTVQITYHDSSVYEITDGNKSLTIEAETAACKFNGSDASTPLYFYTDENGNKDLLVYGVGEQPVAVYDKDWNLVYSVEDDNLMANGLFYDYSNITAEGSEFHENPDAWEVDPMAYLPGGGVDLRYNAGYMKQHVEIPDGTPKDYVIGVVCPELFTDTKLVIDAFDIEWDLHPGLNLYLFEMDDNFWDFHMEI